MKKIFIISFFLLTLAITANCQNSKSFLIGINPAVTIEKSYPKGAFDLNVLPLVIEFPVVKDLNFRAITLLGYGFRNYGSALMNVGVEFALPYYFIFGKSKPLHPSGFFVAPGFAYSRNVYYYHNSYSIFLEPGYNFLITDRFSLIIDMQYGRTFFKYDDGISVTGNHFGVKVVLGWWIK